MMWPTKVILRRLGKRVFVATTLCCATVGLSFAQDMQPVPAATTAAKASLFNRLRSRIHVPWQHGDITSNSPAVQSEPQAEPAALYAGPGIRVVDITTTSNRADEVVDPTCKAIVKPYNAISSTLSLATFWAKLKLESALGVSNGSNMHTLIRRASMQLNWLPAGVEHALGERLLVRDKSSILPRDGNRIARIAYEHADTTLARVLAQIPDKVPYDFKIYVLKEAQGNASSLPGGGVLVDEDVVGRNWDPNVAFFKIAHEVSHVLQRHQTHAYQAAMVDGMDQVSQLRNLIAHVSQQSPTEVSDELWNFKSLVINFSSAQELQADACAVRLMTTEYPVHQKLAGALKDVLASFPPSVNNADAAMKPKDLIGILKVLGNGIYERHPNSAQRRSNIIRAIGPG